jgi:hypothetical protein
VTSSLPVLSERPYVKVWRVIQAFVWFIGFVMLTSLLVFPPLGLLLFWNILIPVAPLLMVVAVGFWRNVCPLASVVLLPRHLGFSRRRIMSPRTQARLGLLGVGLLYLIVPARHALFNTDGPATAMLISALVVAGFVMGTQFEWKSAWCSTLCPVHPVEKLYGTNVIASMPNAHCDACMNCVVPCPDSTPNMHPRRPSKFLSARISGLLIAGGLPGFVWGWFHVPDHLGIGSFRAVFRMYELPIAGMLGSILVYVTIDHLRVTTEARLTRIFAAAAVSCYYWYRIPSLLGFGTYVGDGRLVDAHALLPSWAPQLLTMMSTAFFGYWLLVREPNAKSWVVRPAYGGRAARNNADD